MYINVKVSHGQDFSCLLGKQQNNTISIAHYPYLISICAPITETENKPFLDFFNLSLIQQQLRLLFSLNQKRQRGHDRKEGPNGPHADPNRMSL
jgi:hypothetical protein